jgi:Zn-dependent protease with chaperone function
VLSTEGFDALGGIGEGAAPAMPGRGSWLAWCWGSFAISVAVVVAIAAARPGSASLAIEPFAQLAVFCVLPLMRAVRLKALMRDKRFRTVSAEAVTAALLRAAGPSGVRQVTVRVGPVGGFARCFRAGGHAVLLVHERLPLRPEAARFFIAHEVAHLARYDVFRRPATLMTAFICCFCLAVTWPPLLVPGVLAVVATAVIGSWWMELRCDRLAVRWLGLAPAEQAFALVQRAYRRTFWALVAHPTPRRRVQACRRVSEGAHG